MKNENGFGCVECILMLILLITVVLVARVQLKDAVSVMVDKLIESRW